MEEIKAGEIARLRDGEITRIDKIKENTFECMFKKIRCELYTNFIVKHSPNIIDLIEEGDYVNGIEVMGIYVPRDNWEPIQINVDSQTVKYFLVDQIKSIVTKEQFNQMKYIVGDGSNVNKGVD